MTRVVNMVFIFRQEYMTRLKTKILKENYNNILHKEWSRKYDYFKMEHYSCVKSIIRFIEMIGHYI